MATSGYQPEPKWKWPEELNETKPTPEDEGPRQRVPGFFKEETPPPTATSTKSESQPNAQRTDQQPKPHRTYRARKCRICFEVVQPTYNMTTDSLPGFFQSAPDVTYISEDPESGRLIRPCKCKGSSKYVHEGCLQTWRYMDPSFGKRNYWQCPTCGYKYQLQRMSWGRAINSTFTQLSLTILIFVLAMFALGFVADPILNLYLDPYDTITSGVGLREEVELPVTTGKAGWTEHFVKGLASLGLLGFAKFFFALTPWQWWNLRTSGVLNSGGGNRAGTTGRDRMANISWIVVVLGVLTFLWTVYKAVRAWSRRTLEKASEKVMDISTDEDDEEEDAPDDPPGPSQT